MLSLLGRLAAELFNRIAEQERAKEKHIFKKIIENISWLLGRRESWSTGHGQEVVSSNPSTENWMNIINIDLLYNMFAWKDRK